MPRSPITLVRRRDGRRVPVATRFLEAVLNGEDVAPVGGEDIINRTSARDTIKRGFRDLIVGVIDSDATIPQKLRRIEKLLREWEQDEKAIRSNTAPSPATEAFVRKLVGTAAKSSEQFAARLVGGRAVAKRVHLMEGGRR